jgi:hypothetical protein
VIRGHTSHLVTAPPATAWRAFALASLALAALASTASAQVGYPPDRSPFRDLEFKQEIGGFVGWFAAATDPAGVAPQGGLMVGARYDVRIGGPASFTARLSVVDSKRTVIDPTKPAATRVVGTSSAPLAMADAGITINLTGQKSYRRLVPVLNGGVGLVSDFKGADVGGYKFGTAFAFSFGGGLRYVPGGRLSLRADVGDSFYQLQYPDAYYVRASDSTAVVRSNQAKSFWKHNAAITVGASYLFFR